MRLRTPWLAVGLAFVVIFLVIFVVASAGCGGGRQRTPDDASGPDGGDAAPDVEDASVLDATARDVAAADVVDAAPKPLPVAAIGSRIVVAGAGALVGHGLDSCTNQVPASGDRWCGFGRPAGDTGFFELWVIDATKAAMRAVACDGTDASCLRLSARLFKGTADGFAATGFNGDTLIYDEATFAGTTSAPFMGVVFAWRPGWTAGRALTSATGLYCFGQERSDAALCFESSDGDGMARDLTVELHAGHVTATGTVLPLIDRLLLAAPTDAPGAPPRYQFDLSPDGAYVAWSARATATAVETLHAQRLGTATPVAVAPFVVAQDVSQWAMSPDGLAWYWLASYNYDVTGAPAGTLRTAVFPDGSNATTLATAVGDFAVVGDKGVRFRADVATQVGTLQWLPDRGAPSAVTTIDTKVLTVLAQSRDGARVAYAKTFTPVRATTTSAALDLVDLYVGSMSTTTTGAAPCVVAAAPVVLQVALTASGSVAAWERYDLLTGARDGFATSVAACAPASAAFATSLRNLLPAGDEAFAYLDDADPAAPESTLRYARVMDGALVVGSPVQTRAASVFAPLPSVPALLYTVATGTAADGLYVVDPTTLLPASADAGADAETTE
jgi:hypothetical protein